MAYFSDLSPYKYFEYLAEPNELNIGWLDDQHEFPSGDVPGRVLQTIFELCQRRVNQARGFHVCELCPKGGSPRQLYVVQENGIKIQLGSAEIRVPGEGGVQYAAPDLIYHYIRDHRYRPPQEFIDALLKLR